MRVLETPTPAASVATPGSIRRRRVWVVDLLTAAAVAVALCLPMVIGAPAFFNDWQNHLFLVAKQAAFVERHLGPTFFLSTVDGGWFYPFYAFYGGTLYYLAGLLGVAVGSVWAAYVGSYVLAVAAAFAGWTWLARQAGLPPLAHSLSPLAYLPGIVYVGGAYYLTNAYGRGAWPELVATSALPLALAAAWSLLGGAAVRMPSLLALIASVVVLTGSHIITLVYGASFLVSVLAVGLLTCRPRAARPGRIAFVAAVAGLAAGVNAWFLIPTLAYRDTIAARPERLDAREFDRLDVIFSLTPANPLADSTSQLYVQAPIVPLLAAILACVVGAGVVRGGRLLAVALAVLGGFGAVLYLIVGVAVWDVLPREARVIQFPYRLNIYLLACVAGLIVVAGRYAERVRAVRPRLGQTLLGLLGLSGLVQLGFAQHQIWTAETYGPADAVLRDLSRLPSTWYDRSYYNATEPSLEREASGRANASRTELDALAVEVVVPANRADRRVRTNVVLSPLVELSPPRVVGRAWGHAVVDVRGSREPTRFRAEAARTPWTMLGSALTAASALFLLSMLGYVLARRPAVSPLPLGEG